MRGNKLASVIKTGIEKSKHLREDNICWRALHVNQSSSELRIADWVRTVLGYIKSVGNTRPSLLSQSYISQRIGSVSSKTSVLTSSEVRK
jgi:hypothetical protein